MTHGSIRVEPLDRTRHLLDVFECGNPVLDRWLRAYAGQAQRSDVARTYVAIDERAAAFYHRLGFEPAASDGLTLMVPLAAVRTAIVSD